jgi:hypothetical protein
VVSAALAAMSLCVTWISNFDNHAAAGGWLARDEPAVAAGLLERALRPVRRLMRELQARRGLVLCRPSASAAFVAVSACPGCRV